MSRACAPAGDTGWLLRRHLRRAGEVWLGAGPQARCSADDDPAPSPALGWLGFATPFGALHFGLEAGTDYARLQSAADLHALFETLRPFLEALQASSGGAWRLLEARAACSKRAQLRLHPVLGEGAAQLWIAAGAETLGAWGAALLKPGAAEDLITAPVRCRAEAPAGRLCAGDLAQLTPERGLWLPGELAVLLRTPATMARCSLDREGLGLRLVRKEERMDLWDEQPTGPDAEPAPVASLQDVPVTLTLRLPDLCLTLEEIGRLEPGDHLAAPGLQEAGAVRLQAGGRTLARGRLTPIGAAFAFVVDELELRATHG